jgi:D-alanine--poly(phosphoribitol) ligase subunit 1
LLTSAVQCKPANSLLDLLLASARAWGGRPALCVGREVLSYDELFERAVRLAGAISASSPAQASFTQRQCGLLVNRTPTAYAAVLASLMTGAAYVPLNPRFPRERLLTMLLSSAIDTVIVDRRSHAMAGRLLASVPRRLTVICPDNEVEPAADLSAHQFIKRRAIERVTPNSGPGPRSEEDCAYLLFTSGSTGVPKGVPISHRSLLSYLRSVTERYRPGPEDRFSQLFDFSFDLSAHDMFLAWTSGACVCCAPEDNVLGLGDFIRHFGITFWFSVPSTAAFMRRLRMLKAGSYPTLRYSLFCGESLPMELARVWQEAAPSSIVENLYGPTEATIAFTAYRLPGARGELDQLPTAPIGRPLSGHPIMIVDERGLPVPQGESGELCLGGPQVAAGYWRAAQETAKRFQPPRGRNAIGTRWFRTGDRAVMTTEHGLLFLGRLDRETKIRGHRVDLLEVENAMRRAAGTDTVAALPWPVDEGGLALGIVGVVAGSDKTGQEIIDRCRDTLPDYMVPSPIYRRDDWLLNANGKTDYKALAGLLEQIEDVNVGSRSANRSNRDDKQRDTGHPEAGTGLGLSEGSGERLDCAG